MSSQRGNIAKKGPPKHQNKTAWKNVYHDTSKRSKQIATTEVAGVCRRCKDVIDWKIKYNKYKVLSQPKTCVTCKQKTVKHSYHVHCIPCASKAKRCAKCGESKEIVKEPCKTESEQASEDRLHQFELELLPERKRRTIRRLQEQGKLTQEAMAKLEGGHNDFDDDGDSDISESDEMDEDMTKLDDCDSGGLNDQKNHVSDVEGAEDEISCNEIKECSSTESTVDNVVCEVESVTLFGGSGKVNETGDSSANISSGDMGVNHKDTVINSTNGKLGIENVDKEINDIAQLNISDGTVS